jgi:hypothetical protein
MREIRTIKIRQIVVWKAALLAGLIGGVIALLSNILISSWLLGSPWLFLRVIASTLLGTSVLPPPDSFTWTVFLFGLGIHLVLSMLFAGLIAAVVHQWGMLISFLGGALMGLAFYAITLYTITLLIPWFFPFRSWIFMLLYVLYGAFTGSIYEWLEVERYVEISDGGQ